MSAVHAYVERHRDRHVAELVELLRFPTISALSQHRRDVTACADAVAAQLEAAGLQSVQVRETGGYPILWGEWPQGADASDLRPPRRATGRPTR